MKIAIISDIHDQIDNLNWAINQLQDKNISHIFALGDYASSYIIERLQIHDVPINAVWGNCDGDKQSMLRASQNENRNITFANGNFDTIELEKQRYFITHFPSLAEHAATTLEYDAVFHGHTHYKRNEKIGNTPIINPGKLALYPNDEISFAIFDTKTLVADFIIK
jgi:putative phosphoesterase